MLHSHVIVAQHIADTVSQIFDYATYTTPAQIPITNKQLKMQLTHLAPFLGLTAAMSEAAWTRPVDDLLHNNLDDHAQANRAHDAHLDDQTQANRPDDTSLDQPEQALHVQGPDPAGHTIDQLHNEDVDGPRQAHPTSSIDHLHFVQALRPHSHAAGLDLLAPRLDDNQLHDQALDNGGAPTLLHPLVGLHHHQPGAHSTLHPMVAVVLRNHLLQLVDALHEHGLSHRELLAH
ncbi:hypothetical protein B0A54_05377 [Friedmanniomyces endolithicus]|uniref:Uncharacterized protein n=1 Tax=Friedmanniomyces endolithicus TaxID=329885 RepID=A0A4U0V6Z9_9PEZI|nr:hypothetical protein B0A54_05377 [Friedmanniomyces endolithicus]